MAFKLKPGSGQVFLPKVGLVRPGDTLLGEEYRRFAEAGLLVEVPDLPVAPAVEAPKMPVKKFIERETELKVPMEVRVAEPKTKPVLTEEFGEPKTKPVKRGYRRKSK